MQIQQPKMVVSLLGVGSNHLLGEFLPVLVPQRVHRSCLTAVSLMTRLGRKRLAFERLVRLIRRLRLCLALGLSLGLLLCAWKAPFSLLLPAFLSFLFLNPDIGSIHHVNPITVGTVLM